MLDRETGELGFGVCGAGLGRVVMSLQRLAAPVVAMYAAGPVGAAWLAPRPGGIVVRVCAPGSIPPTPTAQITTDGGDGERPARLVAAGELDVVRVPAPWEQRYPELARCARPPLVI
jgi:hypothetical protein